MAFVLGKAMKALILLTAFCVHMTYAEEDTKCEQTDGKGLLDGCTLLKGLTLTSRGGTVLNDTNCDVLLPKLVFSKEPQIIFKAAKPDKHYTVMVLDPDAKDHKPGMFFMHLIKQNIPGSSFAEGDITKGGDVLKYVGTGPRVGTGDHRYIFIAYEQKTKDLTLTSPKERANFDLNDWIKGLPLCGPVAGVRFRTRYGL